MPTDTPLYFRLLAGLLRPFPAFDFIKPVRARAVDALRLKEGHRVLDLGCGPGESLPFLRAAVGARGDVVGVEISARVAALAEGRIARHGWSNVRVVVAPAERARVARCVRWRADVRRARRVRLGSSVGAPPARPASGSAGRVFRGKEVATAGRLAAERTPKRRNAAPVVRVDAGANGRPVDGRGARAS